MLLRLLRHGEILLVGASKVVQPRQEGQLFAIAMQIVVAQINQYSALHPSS